VGWGEGTAGEKACVVDSRGGWWAVLLFFADVKNQVLFPCCLACHCCWQQEEWALVRLGKAVSVPGWQSSEEGETLSSHEGLGSILASVEK